MSRPGRTIEWLATQPAMVDVPTAAEFLGVGEALVRRMVTEGRLESVRLGRLIRIPRSALGRLAGAE